jgi:hypothetical protein
MEFERHNVSIAGKFRSYHLLYPKTRKLETLKLCTSNFELSLSP